MIVAGNLLTLTFLAFAGFAVKQEIENRKRTENDIRKLNASLELRVHERTTELKQRAKELAGSNSELEAFSYSVSHDLRAPLRHIDGFAGILLETEEGRLSLEAIDCVRRILHAVQAMTGIVDTLLRLAQIERQQLQLRRVPLRQIVGRVIERASVDIGERRVEWRIGKLPEAKCDVDLMTEVFTNIVANALKFSNSREKLRLLRWARWSWTGNLPCLSATTAWALI
jgi:light-regulated signal transduction histidine kinase (bacteriophytochrome)